MDKEDRRVALSCMPRTHRMAVRTKCAPAQMFSLWELQPVAKPIQLEMSWGEPIAYCAMLALLVVDRVVTLLDFRPVSPLFVGYAKQSAYHAIGQKP